MPCVVKEVTPDMVKFILPGEQVLNSIYRTAVPKIAFKNGRVQTFGDAYYYKNIASVADYDMVAIASTDDDTQGLYNIADVTSKAHGVIAYSNPQTVKDRAYQKLKVQAAMFGANIIYVTSQRPVGSDLSEGSLAGVEMTGFAYSSILPDYDKFKKMVAGKDKLFNIEIYKLGQYDGDLSHDTAEKPFKINNIKNENGIIKIDADLAGEKNVHTFQLANFNDTGFNIAYVYNRTTYNLRVSWQ